MRLWQIADMPSCLSAERVPLWKNDAAELAISGLAPVRHVTEPQALHISEQRLTASAAVVASPRGKRGC